MKLFVYFFLYTLVVYGENNPPRKLVRKKRIISGEVVNDGAGTFMASLQRRSDRAHLCGGSLITLRHMITSCSCVAHSDDSASGITTALPEGHVVIAGSKNNYNLEAAHVRNVSRMEADYRCRYNFEAGMWEYDLGYITVADPYTYMDNKLGIVKNIHETQEELDHDLAVMMNNTEFLEGGKEFCYVFGWGAGSVKIDKDVFDTADYVADLKHRAVQFVERINCKTRLCGINEAMCAFDLDKNHCFCAVAAGGLGGPLCDADNGSPLLCYNRIYAVGETLFECGSVKASLFFTVDIESLRHYILTGSSVVKTQQKWLLLLLTIVARSKMLLKT